MSLLILIIIVAIIIITMRSSDEKRRAGMVRIEHTHNIEKLEKQVNH